MMWIIPTYSCKMAKNRNIPRLRGIFVGRQARALLNVMAYFENERQRERAGRGPILFPNNGIGRAVGQGRGLPHDRVPIPSIRMPQPWGSLFQEREGQRSLSQYPPLHLHQLCLNLWAEDFPLHPHLILPLLLKIVLHLGGARRPLLGNHALCPAVYSPMVISQPHLHMLFMIQMPPTL